MIGVGTGLALVCAQPPPPASNSTPLVVGSLGSPEMIDFSGNDSFSERALREGLSGLPELILASHPSAPRDKFLATVQQALERGYRGHGFLHSQISAATDPAASRVRVSIVEGLRFKCGDIRIDGTHDVAAEEILRDLTTTPGERSRHRSLEQAIETVLANQRTATKEDPAAAIAAAAAKIPAIGIAANASGLSGPGNEPFQNSLNALVQPADTSAATEAFWTRDDPAPFRAGFTDDAAARVRTFLATRGRALAEVSAELKPDEPSGRAHLHLQIKEAAA